MILTKMGGGWSESHTQICPDQLYHLLSGFPTTRLPGAHSSNKFRSDEEVHELPVNGRQIEPVTTVGTDGDALRGRGIESLVEQILGFHFV
jgi:hypothetical protein